MFPTYTPAFTNDVSLIPAAYLNQIRIDVGRAIDGAGGGSYAPSAAIDVQGSGFGTIDVATMLEILLGGQIIHPVGAQIADVNNQTFALSGGLLREFATPTAARTHDLSVTGATAGSWIHFMRPAAGAFNIDINRSGFGAWPANGIVRLPAATWSAGTVYYDGANWRLLTHAAAIPGTLA